MLLKKLNLINFRNYAKLDLDFDERTTILLGNNAVGKSNILESIYFLSTTKSGRVDREEELIKEGEEFCKASGVLSTVIASEVKQSSSNESQTKIATKPSASRNDEIILEIAIQTIDNLFSKRLKVNGIPKRAVDFIGNLPAVIFYPSDINLVTGAPSLRRWHLDLSVAQVDPVYKKALTLYEQVLVSRNRVLKRIREGQGKKDELRFWTDELLNKGKEISDKRKVFFDFINNLEKPLGGFIFEYLPSEFTMERLEETNGREIAAAATLIGPHRDDFILKLGNRNLAHFGSRGEQRIATLAFKFLSLEYMAKILRKRPILLLDDVFSELDADHRAAVVEIVNKQQTIIATVELENIPKEFLDSARILKVEDGRISETE